MFEMGLIRDSNYFSTFKFNSHGKKMSKADLSEMLKVEDVSAADQEADGQEEEPDEEPELRVVGSLSGQFRRFRDFLEKSSES